MTTLRPPADHITGARRVLLERWLRGELAGTVSARPTLVPDPSRRYEPFPLMPEQARLLQTLRANERPERPLHYVEVDCEAVDAARLAQAWQRLCVHHDMLRAVLDESGTQRVQPSPTSDVTLTQLAPAAVRAALFSAAWAPGTPAAELILSCREDGGLRLHAAFDPILLDAPTLHMVVMQWRRLYEDLAAPMLPLELSFRDYVLALQRLSLDEGGRSWWRVHIETLAASPFLIPGQPASVTAAPPGRCCARLLAPEWRAVKAALGLAGVTPSAALLTAYGEVLARRAATAAVRIGVTLFERHLLHSQVNELAGNFAAVVPINAPPVISSFAARIQATQRGLLELLGRTTAGVPAEATAIADTVLFTSALASFTEGSVADAHAISANGGPFDWLGPTVLELARRPGTVLDLHAQEDTSGLVLNAYYDGAALQADGVEHMLAEMIAIIQSSSVRLPQVR